MPSAMTPRDMLARLVSFPTVSSRSNLDLVDFVEDWLAAHGAQTRRVADATGTKASLLAWFGPAATGGVVLSGHTDVVPVDGQDWASDPFVLTERDGRLHGRGTCDMKGFCAAVLALAPEMAAARLSRPVVIALSRDEEVGCLGTPDVIEALRAVLPPPEAVIVGEPTSMRVVNGHKGSWGYRARVRGHEVHSSLAHRGVSAVTWAARLVVWMADRMDENAARPGPGGFEPPFTTLHTGLIRGGTANNITARGCSFSGEIRVLPGEPVAAWRERVTAEAARLEAQMRAIHPNAAFRIETRMEIPALGAEPDGAAERLARQLTGDNAVRVVSYQTEAGHFQAAGLSTAVCGPGSIEQAHRPDEYITPGQLAAGTAFVRRLVDRLAA